jgi:hypothetical protein
MPDQAIADLRRDAHHGASQGRDPDRDLLAQRRLGGLQLGEGRPVVVALEGLESAVGTLHDVPHRGHRLAQVGQRLVLGRAVDVT